MESNTTSQKVYVTGPYSNNAELDLTYAKEAQENSRDAPYEKVRTLDEIKNYTEDKIDDEFQRLQQDFAWGSTKPVIGDFGHLNIYCDVHPFAETSVSIKENPGKQLTDETYINANYVKSAFREDKELIIATQGPQEHTMHTFWDMVDKTNVKRIVTLCHVIGNYRDADAFQYFPKQEGETITFKNGYEIKTTKLTQEEHVLVRELELTLGKKSHKLTHYHFIAWQDWGVPTGPSLKAYQALIKDTANFVESSFKDSSKDGKPARLVVHCRAGIGRTGTTIALINSVLTLKHANGTICPFSIVRRLREQRVHMVQVENQYQFIFQFLSAL